MNSDARLRTAPEPAVGAQRHHRTTEQDRPGPASVPELCAALDDPDLEVRIRTAQTLGEIGDKRAIGPLTDALADLSEARYAGVRRRRMIARVAAFVAVGSGVFGALFSAGLGLYFPLSPGLDLGDSLTATLLVAAMLGLAALLVTRHRPDTSRSRALTAFADALGELALRHPSPDLRGALDDLTASRAAAGRASAEWLPTIDRAIERIEEATAEVQQLPLPSEQPDAPIPNLPLPANRQRDVSRSLPRASD